MTFALVLLGIAICTAVGVYIGTFRGRAFEGGLFAFILGPIGWVIILGGPNRIQEKKDAQRDAQLRYIRDLLEHQIYGQQATGGAHISDHTGSDSKAELTASSNDRVEKVDDPKQIFTGFFIVTVIFVALVGLGAHYLK